MAVMVLKITYYNSSEILVNRARVRLMILESLIHQSSGDFNMDKFSFRFSQINEHSMYP